MQYKLVNLEEIPRSTKDPTKELSLVEIFKICNHMEKVCLDNDGVGLSAVQVGLPWDLFIVNRDNIFEYYLNCRYESQGDLVAFVEGCLSLKDSSGAIRRFEIKRYSSVLVTGQRLQSNGDFYLQDFSNLESGFYSAVFQHEIDHSFGIFIKDKGKEIFVS